MNEPNQPSNGKKSSETGQIPTASSVANECHPDATAASVFVQQPADKRATANVTRKRNVTSTNTKRHTLRKKATANVTLTCAYCNAEFLAKTSRAKYCSAMCRRDAWLERNPERAAELAESDKARLRAHLEAKGIEWIEPDKTLTEET